VTAALVNHAQPRPGMRVLDVASGTGEPAISLAARVGEQGTVTALDLSADLLAIAEKRAQTRGLTNFKTQSGDAHALPFADNPFDLATSRFGVMFFRDVGAALGELRRVLRARASFLAWGSFDQPYWQSMMGVVYRHVGGPLLHSGEADSFRFAQSGSLSAMLRDAGFHEVAETSKTLPWAWPGSAEEVWDYARAVSVPFHPMLERVPADRWPEIHAAVQRALEKYSDGRTIAFGASVVFASGKKEK
jgi:ubiquinone/menaquinone biosynthesis C-methylase UbiE